MYECDSRTVYDDNNLPDGIYDDVQAIILPCTQNAAIGWAIGGDYVSFQRLIFLLRSSRI
jgi:hypothetical protein